MTKTWYSTCRRPSLLTRTTTFSTGKLRAQSVITFDLEFQKISPGRHHFQYYIYINHPHRQQILSVYLQYMIPKYSTLQYMIGRWNQFKLVSEYREGINITITVVGSRFFTNSTNVPGKVHSMISNM